MNDVCTVTGNLIEEEIQTAGQTVIPLRSEPSILFVFKTGRPTTYRERSLTEGKRTISHCKMRRKNSFGSIVLLATDAFLNETGLSTEKDGARTFHGISNAKLPAYRTIKIDGRQKGI